MRQVQPTSHADTDGLAAGLGAGLAFLALSLIPYLSLFGVTARQHFVWRVFDGQSLLGTQTGAWILWFVLAVLALYLAFGLGIWWAARGLHRWSGDAPEHRLAWVAGIATLWSFIALLANAGLFPISGSGVAFRDLAAIRVAGIAVWQFAVAILLASLLPAAWQAVQRRAQQGRRPLLLTLTAILAMVAVLAAPAPQAPERQLAAARGGRPNIIVIGIDSLRLAEIGTFGGQQTPNLDRFVADARLFSHVFTSFPRTFGAWMTVLTGQEPRTNGVRFNLMPPSMFETRDTLAHEFQAAGYRTVYATDEVRFANIEEQFGFDQIIGPPIGTSDFILAWVSDLPLVNPLVNTRPGRWLFPNAHGNRAAAKTYRPQTFERMLWSDLEVPDDRPLFLITHLTLPHWPVYWADAPPALEYVTRPGVRDRVLLNAELYRAALRETDAQLGRVLAGLERSGLLEDSIVVLLSDHGEALGLPEELSLRDVVLPDGVEALTIRTGAAGHGTSVLQPLQYRCLLAFRSFGPRTWATGEVDEAVALIDVAPTLRTLSGLPAGRRQPDGIDLAPVVRGDAGAEVPEDRAFFTETGFNPAALLKGDDVVDERRVMLEGAPFYRVDLETSRVTFRPEVIPELLAKKERAVIRPPWLLAALPRDEHEVWILLNLATGRWVRYPEDAALLGASPAARLEADLRSHFGPEVAAPAPWPAELVVAKPR